MAVACSQEGLRTDNFYSALLHNRVAYHDFEGLTVRDDEKPRLVANLGNKGLLILRNHGLLTCGRTIPEAFINQWTLERSCDCLLYTSDAADDSLRVDLGGRRIIKKVLVV